MADPDHEQGSGSPFSLVLAAGKSDTTTETAARPDDSGTESSIGVGTGPGMVDDAGDTHVAGQDETPGAAKTEDPVS